MIVNKIRSNFSCFNTSFKGNAIDSKANLNPTTAINDAFIKSDSSQPPVISDEQLHKNKITDAQIIQMNKSKKLPANAMLNGIPKARRQGVDYDSYDNRFHYVVAYCHQTFFDKSVRRDIPEGYVAARGPNNKVFVVKKEDAIVEIKKKNG